MPSGSKLPDEDSASPAAAPRTPLSTAPAAGDASPPRAVAPPEASSAHYWSASRRPLPSLVLVAPFLVIYELGVVTFGVQNGADVWMRWLLGGLGFGQHLLLPCLTVGVLLGWHYLARDPWRLPRGVVPTMFVESLVMGVVLWLLSVLYMHVAPARAPLENVAAFGRCLNSIFDRAGSAIGYFGAGIYEELLFRLILLSALAWAGRAAGLRPTAAWGIAVAVSSVLFAAAHYVGPAGDSFSWDTFGFRLLAGVFFAILFVYRGFGIAAGAHAAYDIVVGAILR